MTKLNLFGTAALVMSSALASPAMAQQVVTSPARCSQFYPNANCQNLGANNPYTGDYQRRVAYRTSHRHWRREAWRNEDMRNGQYGPGWYASTDDGWRRRDDNPLFWPGDVAAGVVGGAAAAAGAAVNTAGAVATAPFRNDAYAYYNGGYNGYHDNGWNNNGWNDWDRRTYAERNGFVCEPGTWFKGDDGRRHICQ